MTVMDIAALEAMMAAECPQAALAMYLLVLSRIGAVALAPKGGAEAYAHATLTSAIPPLK
jgi:hypothetical protein